MTDTALGERIKLSFPVNATYVSSARLTAGSIANRMGFYIDEIEEIKTAVSEACTFIIQSLSVTADSAFEISFNMKKNTMEIRIVTQGVLVHLPQADDMSMVMIKALMDDFDLVNDDGEQVTIRMIKKHKASIFEF